MRYARNRRRLRAVALMTAALGWAAMLGCAPAAHAGVMMEGFYLNCPSGYGSDWWWDHLAQQAGTLADDGFSAIWIPCALKGASGGYSSGYDPFDDYDLGSKNQMGTIPTHYGTRLQLERACAIMKANGLQVYEDIVDSHRNGDPGNYSFQYVGADGTPGEGRFPKGPSDFYPNVPMASDIPDQSTSPDGRWIQPTTGGQYIPPGSSSYVCYAGYNMELSGDWLTKALDLDGYRLDDVKASPQSWLNQFLNYGAMAGKFAVGEYYDGNVSSVVSWIQNPNGLNNRASAFDFPLKFNYLNPMCNDPGSFDMASLNGAGLVGVLPDQAVTFVENHDTDGSDPIVQDKLLAYAYILTSQGYPCVFYKDWSTDPGCYGAGMQAGIDNLIWIHEKIAAGDTVQRWMNNQIYCFERLGGDHLLVGMSDDTQNAHTVTCATGFGPNVDLHDYTGHEPDVVTDGSGNATITIPPDTNGASYVCYSVAGISGPFTPVGNATTQEYAGAPDLDIMPADDTKYIVAAPVEVQSGAAVGESLYFDTTGWTSSTRILVELLGPTHLPMKTKAYTVKTAQGAALSAIASQTGLYTFMVRSEYTPAVNPMPDYWLKATYTAPATIVPVTFTVDAPVKSGFAVYLCGNVADIGNWSPAKGLLLNPSGSGSSETWSGEVALPASSTYSYKYVKWNGKNAVWEKIPDRTITTAASGDMSVDDGQF